MSYAPRGTERWDRSRFDAHASRGGVAERDIYEEHDYYRPPPQRERSADYHQREAPRTKEYEYYDERDRYHNRPSKPAPRYYEEVRDPYEGAMVPAPRERREIEIDIHERDRQVAHRPKFVRRQSSLDTFDRKPMPRYGDRPRDETYYLPTRPRRTSPPRYSSPPLERERDTYYDDIRVAEPDAYGDEHYHGYREREVERWRSNKESVYEEERAETVIEEQKEYPRKGKTKIPKRLVNKQAVIELNYPFEEEGETLIILKALGKDHIDEVIRISKEMNAPPPAPPSVHAPSPSIRPSYDPPQGEREVRTTTYVFEHGDAKPPPPDVIPIPPPPAGFEDAVLERRTEVIHEGALVPEIPRSVRDWDVMSGKKSVRAASPSGSHHSRKTSKSHRSRRRSRAASASHARRRSSSSDSPRREIIAVSEREESASIHGPIQTLVVADKKDRSREDIEAEIRALKAERRLIRSERDYTGGEVIISRERRSRSRSRSKERESVEVRKDKKAPDPRIIRAMLATLT